MGALRSVVLLLGVASCSAFTAKVPMTTLEVHTSGRAPVVAMRNYWSDNAAKEALREKEARANAAKAEALRAAHFDRNPGDTEPSQYVDAYRQAQYPFMSLTQRCVPPLSHTVPHAHQHTIPLAHHSPEHSFPYTRSRADWATSGPNSVKQWGSKPLRMPDQPRLPGGS